MILTRLNLPHADRNAIFARPLVCARTSRRSFVIRIARWQRSAPGWLGKGNQKPSPLRSRTAASDHGSYDQQAEAVIRSPNPISITRSLPTTSLSCSSMRTASAVGARLHRSTCAPGESNESTRTLNRKCRSRRTFADLHTTDGRVDPFATTKPPIFDGRRTFGCAFSNTLTGRPSNRVGGLT